MSFSVRRVEDPTIYVRRNKPDILGNAWDDIANFKDTLNRLEDNLAAANAKPKALKRAASFTGPVLKEISSETQHFGKVTRFQLLGDKSGYKSLPKHSISEIEIKTRRKNVDHPKTAPVSDVSTVSMDKFSQGRNGYSPTRYTANSSKNEKKHGEVSSFFKTTTINPVVLNESSFDLDHNKDSSLTNSTVNTSSNSQQFSLSSSSSFHGRAVLAKNEAALQKIKEKVQKQKAVLSKQDEDLGLAGRGNRKLHDSSDQIEPSTEPEEKVEELPLLPMKRKVGAVSSSGPTYKGFNSLSPQKICKSAAIKPKPQQPNTNKPPRERKPSSKPAPKPEAKAKKAKMNRITSCVRPKEVITTSSWRQGQATVKKILGVKKVKASGAREKPSEKPDTTYSVSSPTNEELSEGKLSDSDQEMEIPRREKEEIIKGIPDKDGAPKPADVRLSAEPNEDLGQRFKDVLSTDAQSMLADLAQDKSESENESERKEEKKPKPSGTSRKPYSGKRTRTNQKPVVQEKYPKEKLRHYDQNEIQKYMAQQTAERKKKQKQEKIMKKKQEEEKQRRLKDLYERQKKSVAPSKKEKQFGQTFSCGTEDVGIPENEGYRTISQDYIKVDHGSNVNESDKENTDLDASSEMSYTPHTGASQEDSFTDDFSSNEPPRKQAVIHVGQPTLSLPFDQRAQRLTALKATALALQSRLKSQALRLGGASEQVMSQPVSKVVVKPKEKETEFQGALPGVADIRKQANDNEKQSRRVKAATMIQSVYRGHTVRKRFQWFDGNRTSDKNSVASSDAMLHEEDKGLVVDDGDMVVSDDDESSSNKHHSGGSAHDDYAPLRPFYTADLLNDGSQFKSRGAERSYFRRADTSARYSSHVSGPSFKYEPKGDRFSVMNIFSRRHPTVSVEDILNEHPGSETASLLQVGGSSGKTDQIVDYEDDFTDEDISTASVLTDGDLKKDSPVASKGGTYSECFETDEDGEDSTKHKEEPEDHAKVGPSAGKDAVVDPLSSKAQPRTPLLSTEDNVISPEVKDVNMIPVMTSTMHPDHDTSPSFSDDSEHLRKHVFTRPMERAGGNRLSPDSLQRKLTAEINLLENVEDSVRQLNDIEKTRAVSLAQQETVSLAQILKAKQQSHEKEIQNLRLKAKDEAIQAAKDLEKTRQAAATAAASASEKLAEVQNEVLKTNTENSRKYVEEASNMTSDVLSTTSHKLAEFCRNITATTSAAVRGLHSINRPTTILVERATSFSAGHTLHSADSSKSDEQIHSSDICSIQSKSSENSPSVTSSRQPVGYSSDEFDSYKSRTAGNEESDIKTEPRRSVSVSAESILEDLPDKSVSDDDTTMNEESANDTQSLLFEEPKKLDKEHRPVSPLLDYSSQFEDSSHALTDDDIDFRILLPSKEHRRKSIKRIMDDSFEEDKGKKKIPRTPFESDDFSKFTADMIQKYVREEEVRTKHQAAILRLREKSLKEKTKAELQWLEQLKKQSRDKGSDDVMPSIKKRERGILMKHKAEKEEIKRLQAANRAANFQSRFMIYQQQKIDQLHQTTMNIRERLEKDASKKSSRRSSIEPSESDAKTSSPPSKTASNAQSSPPDSSPKTKKSSKNVTSLSGSPSARSVSEDVNEEQGPSHASQSVSGSPFPSYSTPKTDGTKKDEVRDTAQAQQETETSTVLNMLSLVDSGEPNLSGQNGESLLKIYKILVERQQKLAKDEYEVNSMLQKVAEMINNQRNHVSSRSSHGNDISESIRSPTIISEAKASKVLKYAKSSRSESSIPEDILSGAKTLNEEIKEIAEKTLSEYENCTFESDEATPSRRSASAQDYKQGSEVHVEEELLSMTETSDHSDYEEKIRKLKEELHKEKMKAEALEKKKRKMKRSALRIEVLNLENELKNTRDDILRKRTEIKTAAAAQPTTPSPPSVRSSESPHSPRKERLAFPMNKKRPSQKPPKNTVSSQDTSKASHTLDGQSNSSAHEVEESLIEVLGVSLTSQSLNKSVSATDLSVKARTNGFPSLRAKGSAKESPAFERTATSHALDDLSEHFDSDSRSTTSISEESGAAEDKRSPPSKASSIPEEIAEKSYNETKTSPSVHELIPSVVEDLHAYGSHERTPGVPDKGDEYSYTEPRSSTSIFDNPEKNNDVEHSEPRSNESISDDVAQTDEKIAAVPDEELEYSYTDPRSSVNDSEDSYKFNDKSPSSSGNGGDDIYIDPQRSTSVSEELEKSGVDELSYTEPRSSTVISEVAPTSHKKSKQSVEDLEKSDERSPSVLDRVNEASHIELRSSTAMSDTSPTSPRKPKQKTGVSDAGSEQGSDGTRKTSQNPSNISGNSQTERSKNLAGVEEISGRSVKDSESGRSNGGRNGLQDSLIAEEIPSDYEGVLDDASKEEESEGLTFGDVAKLESRMKGRDGQEDGRMEAGGLIAKEPAEPERKVKEIDEREGGSKEQADDGYADIFTHSSHKTPVEDTSPKSKILESVTAQDETDGKSEEESSKSEDVSDMGAKEERESQKPENEQYSEDFEADDETVSEDIPEVLELDEGHAESEDEDRIKMFTSVAAKETEDEVRVDEMKDVKDRVRHDETGDELRANKYEDEIQLKGTSDESNARSKGVVDDITDTIYREIMDDSFETVRNRKQKFREAGREVSDVGQVPRVEVSSKSRIRSGSDVAEGITKDILAEAILQMISIKRRYCPAKSDKEDTKTTKPAEDKALDNIEKVESGTVKSRRDEGPSDKSYSGKSFPDQVSKFSPSTQEVIETCAPSNNPTEDSPSATSRLGVLPGFGRPDELTAVNNALLIAKTNKDLDDESLKTMDHDIEGLLGTPLDEDDEDFPVNENIISDIPSDDTEPSVHEYSPMLAVPHNLQELTSTVNSTLDVLESKKREGSSLHDFKPPAQLLCGETDNELECGSIRSYRHLIFDLTKEVYIDTVSVDELANQPPWAKTKWKGGQKLSRNFRRWKSDDQVRAVVLERVTNLIGLGAPRPTMQTLQRKTPVRGNKKDNVDVILIEELRQEEPQWTDYEEDETAVKFQVADDILNMLLDDTVRVFNAIQAKKTIPDNVLVV